MSSQILNVAEVRAVLKTIGDKLQFLRGSL